MNSTSVSLWMSIVYIYKNVVTVVSSWLAITTVRFACRIQKCKKEYSTQTTSVGSFLQAEKQLKRQ